MLLQSLAWQVLRLQLELRSSNRGGPRETQGIIDNNGGTPSSQPVVSQARLKSSDKGIIDDILTIGQYAGGVVKAGQVRTPSVNVLDYLPLPPNLNAANREGSSWFSESKPKIDHDGAHPGPVAGPCEPQVAQPGAWYVGLVVTTTPPGGRCVYQVQDFVDIKYPKP